MNTHDDGRQDGHFLAAESSLGALQQEFPRYRIWQEKICGRVRHVARSLEHDLHPHTVVTGDVAELAAALEPSRNAALVHRAHPDPPGRAVGRKPADATSAQL